MLSLVLLVMFAALVATLGRRSLSRATWTNRAPRLGMLVWLVSTFSVAVALLLAGFTLLLPDLFLSADLARMIHACVAEVRDRYSTPMGFALPLVGATLATVALIRLVILGAVEHVRASWNRHVMRRDLAAVGRREPACQHSADYVSLDQDAAMVYCVPGGRNATVVVTSGAKTLLSHDELAAALGHERAHLRSRHHIPILLSRVLAAAFMQQRFFKESAQQIALLAEMDADDGARHMPGLQGALARLAIASTPLAALGAGGASAITRLRRLRESPAPLSIFARSGICLASTLLMLTPVGIALVPAIQALFFDCCGGVTTSVL